METEPAPVTDGPRHRLEEPAPEPTPAPVYDDAGHTLDYAGEPIHVDVDPIIPTGLCRYC